MGAHKKYTTQKFSTKYKFFGPLGEKLRACTQKPKISDDGKFWLLPEGATCTDFFCNFKHDPNRTKYKKIECVNKQIKIESTNFNGLFTPNPEEKIFLSDIGRRS